TFIQRERARIAILRDLRVLHAVGDVRPVAAVEHLNARVREIEDDAVCILLLLRANELERTGQLDRVRIVFLDGDELLRPILNVRTEAADRDFDRLSALGLSKRLRQLEELERLLERDRVHALMRTQAREPRLLFIVFRAELHERSVLAVAHRDGLAGHRIRTELARLGDVLSRHGFVDDVDLLLELLPETIEDGNPFLFAVRDLVEIVLHLGREAVVDIVLEIAREELVHDLAEVRRYEPAIDELGVFLADQRLNDARVRRRPPDAVLFERLDEARFGVPRRRLGNMLLGPDFEEFEAIADFDGRGAEVAVVGG